MQDRAWTPSKLGILQKLKPILALEDRGKDVELGDGTSFLFFESPETLSERQQSVFKFLVFQASRIGSMAAEELPQIVEWSLPKLKDLLIFACEQQGIQLTEDAWAWIDAEEDHELLRFLLSCSGIKNNEQSFWKLRKALFENRALGLMLS